MSLRRREEVVAERRKEEEVRVQHDVVVDWRGALFGFSFLDVDVGSVVPDLSNPTTPVEDPGSAGPSISPERRSQNELTVSS